jgi:hypothetical protein
MKKGITANASFQLDSLRQNTSTITTLLNQLYTERGTEERIIFLINNRDMVGGVAGFASTLSNSIVIFKSALTKWSTFVHEVGHTLGLQHPFNTRGFTQGNSNNYMDYTYKRNMFWQWQWKIINNIDF